MNPAGTALILTGGHSHPPELSIPALTEVLAGHGFDPVVTVEDVESTLSGLRHAPPDLLVVNALRWTMRHPRYDDHRAQWATALSAQDRLALSGFVRGGGSLLAMHTALVCFDDWPAWSDLIGAAWDWDRSHHPPIGAVEVRFDGHPVTDGIATFTVTDECYTDLRFRPGNQVVATVLASEGAAQPACWLREVGRGRVATSTLGHDLRSLDHPAHRALLARLLTWLTTTETDHERGPET